MEGDWRESSLLLDGEASFLLPSSCRVERFPPANSPPAPQFPPSLYFCSYFPSPPFLSPLIPSSPFCSFLQTSQFHPPPPVSLLPSRIAYRMAVQCSLFCLISLESKGVHLSSVDLRLFHKHICRQTTHRFSSLVKESLSETAVRNVPRSERKSGRQSETEQVESEQRNSCAGKKNWLTDD